MNILIDIFIIYLVGVLMSFLKFAYLVNEKVPELNYFQTAVLMTAKTKFYKYYLMSWYAILN